MKHTALSILLLAGVVLCQREIERSRSRSQSAVVEHLYLDRASTVAKLWTGLTGLGADIYWLRVTQYYGGQRAFAVDKRFDLLAPLLDITVTLDPRFDIAYKYGAIFLSERAPLGAGTPQAGIELLERGSRLRPNDWRLRQHLAYCTFLYLQDSQKASAILTEASEIPGAPFWLRSMAAQILLKSGEHQSSRAIWRQFYETGTGFMRDIAKFNLDRLDAADQAAAIEDVVKAWKARTGSFPTSLTELQKAGLLRQPLVDSTGKPFDYDAATGDVRINRRSMLWSSDLR